MRKSDHHIGTPKPSSEVVRRRMMHTPQRDTPPEIKVRKILYQMGLRFRVDVPPINGLRCKADIVFFGPKVAVFIDGCFWHGCPIHGTWPRANAQFWRNKIEGNRARDKRITRELRRAGWGVIRVWEHENPVRSAAGIAKSVHCRHNKTVSTTGSKYP
jgi:DNA mismatch endonuclease, patch repair protein